MYRSKRKQRRPWLELRKDLDSRVETRTRDLKLANEMLSASIAQQLRFEQELRRREAELQMVLQNANDAYVCIDHHGVIRDWNQQSRTYLRLEPRRG